MEFEGSAEMNTGDKIRQIIAECPDAINSEFTNGSGNSWYACLLTQLTPINTILCIDHKNGIIDDQIYNQANDRLQALIAEAQARVEEEVDQQTKDEALAELEAIGQGL